LSPTLSEKQQDYNNSAFFVPKEFVYNLLISKVLYQQEKLNWSKSDPKWHELDKVYSSSIFRFQQILCKETYLANIN